MMETGGSAAQATQSRATAAIDAAYSAHRLVQEVAAAGQILAHRITIATAVALLSTILATVAIVPALICRN